MANSAHGLGDPLAIAFTGTAINHRLKPHLVRNMVGGTIIRISCLNDDLKARSVGSPMSNYSKQSGSWHRTPARVAAIGVLIFGAVIGLLESADADIMGTGQVEMRRDEDGQWHAFNELGTEIQKHTLIPVYDYEKNKDRLEPCQGLQNAINYAAIHGYDLHVSGGGVTHTKDDGQRGDDPAQIFCTETLYVPAMQKASLDFGGITIDFSHAHETPDREFKTCVEFESAMMLSVNFRGQIVCHHRPAITFAPSRPVPGDGLITIIDSNFYFTTAVTDNSDAVVDFQIKDAEIVHSKFVVIEMNGGECKDCTGPSKNGFRIVMKPGTAPPFGIGALEIDRFRHNFLTTAHGHGFTDHHLCAWFDLPSPHCIPQADNFRNALETVP
jgi:hypothetical protein